MAKYLDLKVGKEIKLYRFASGVRQDGNKWALFSFTPYDKNDKGDYIYGQEYTIFINNISQVDYPLKDGDKVEIANIISVTAEDSSYKGKDGVQHSKRVIRVVVDIKIENKGNKVPQNPNGNQYQNNNNNSNDNYPPVYEGGYDFPNF